MRTIDIELFSLVLDFSNKFLWQYYLREFQNFRYVEVVKKRTWKVKSLEKLCINLSKDHEDLKRLTLLK